MSSCDVAIIGAGPYGLSAAAFLRATDSLKVHVFGRPMEFWQRMPAGMLLRSPWEASHIADPTHALTLDAYQAQNGATIPDPVPLESFVSYGRWFQEQLVPDVDRREVKSLESANGSYRLQLEDGVSYEASRVVVAAGIEAFAWRPSEFSELPAATVSHSSEHADLGHFAEQRVLVVGGGQSALESAALLRESGAYVEVVVRAEVVHWLIRSAGLHRLRLARRLLYAPPDVGPAGFSWLVAYPGWFRRSPWRLQEWLGVRSIRPAGAAWLIPRLEGVPITTGRSVASATPGRDGICVVLDDGGSREVDHVLLATGYRPDISGYSFLAPGLLAAIDRVDGYPVLGEGFESSMPGLHFVGAPAARSFGPLMRFVAGTGYAAAALGRSALRPGAGGARSAPVAR